MAETTLVKQEISLLGLDEAFIAGNADGSKFTCPDPLRTYIHVTNTNAGIKTMTIHAQKLSNQGTLDDAVIPIPALTGDLMCGPMESYLVDGAEFVHVTYDDVTNVLIVVTQNGA